MVSIFRQPAEVNFRAVRDMGLAAWWGSSLATLASLMPASAAEKDPKDRARVLDAGLKGARGFQAGSVLAYLLGVGLVRFNGNPFGSYGVPRWIGEGLENTTRSIMTGAALAAGVAASKLRDQEMKLYEEKGSTDSAESLRNAAHLLHAFVPAATGWLLYSHLKEDVAAMRNGGR